VQQLAAAFTTTYPQSQSASDLQTQLQEFFIQRLRSLLQEDWGIDYDLVSAVLGNEDREYAVRALNDVLDVRDRAEFLQQIRRDGTLDQIYETVNRAARLAAQGELDTAMLDPDAVIDPQQFQQPSEQAFYEALLELVPQTETARQQRDYRQLCEALAQIAPTVSRFFDGPDSVLVMDPNPAIRRNRLNLLGILRNHARVLADFGAIVKS
jgi:glycyl-tRNA synthetase beta chain